MDELTAARLREIVDYDSKTGVFTWKTHKFASRIGKVAGCIKEGAYVYINIDGKMRYGHRLAWLYTHGSHPDGQVDHIDGDGLNNSMANLRVVSIAVNRQNQRHAQASNKTSGLLGVYRDPRTGRWRAQIQVNKKIKHLGTYADKHVAHAAYVAAKRIFHEGCTI